MPATLTWPGKDSAFAMNALTNNKYSLLNSKSCTELITEHSQNPANYAITSDNLYALHYLKQAAFSFQFIYIDPPYNTGQKFSYSDKINAQNKKNTLEDSETLWLDMIAPRLLLAKDVLAQDGVIFISIDDRQLASLLLLMYEIFGKNNQIGILKWKKKRKPSFLDKHLSTVIEYILVFTKDKSQFKKLTCKICGDITRPVLNASNTICERILFKGTEARCNDGKYTKAKLINKTLELEFLDDWEVKDGVLTTDVRVNGRFRVSQELISKTAFITKNRGLRRHVLNSEKSLKLATDNFTDKPTNEDADTELRQIFGKKIFDYPKPVGLLYELLAMCQFSDKTIKCLDFFAGSGTLAEAILFYNQKHNTRHQFFVIQSTEVITNNNAPEFLNIAQLMNHRIEKCIEKYNSALPTHFCTLKMEHPHQQNQIPLVTSETQNC